MGWLLTPRRPVPSCCEGLKARLPGVCITDAPGVCAACCDREAVRAADMGAGLAAGPAGKAAAGAGGGQWDSSQGGRRAARRVPALLAEMLCRWGWPAAAQAAAQRLAKFEGAGRRGHPWAGRLAKMVALSL